MILRAYSLFKQVLYKLYHGLFFFIGRTFVQDRDTFANRVQKVKGNTNTISGKHFPIFGSICSLTIAFSYQENYHSKVAFKNVSDTYAILVSNISILNMQMSSLMSAAPLYDIAQN